MNAKTHDLTIDYVGIDDLIPYEHNARKHEPKDIDAIMQSIREFGFNDPIGVWKDNVIIEGHGRLLAAKKLGLDSVPVIHLDHMNDEQRKAYALAHNRTAELSEWDFVVRDEELAAISEIDMSVFGFDLDKTEEEPTTKEATYNENISLIVEFETESDAEELYTRLMEEGYSCRISTL